MPEQKTSSPHSGKGTTTTAPQPQGPGPELLHVRGLIDKGEWKQALVQLDRMQQSTTKNLEGRTATATIHLLKARALLHLGEITKSWAESDRAISMAKLAQAYAIEAEAQCVVANILWKKSELGKALIVLDKAFESATKAKDERVLGIVSLERASIHGKQKDFHSAEREYREAILALEKVGEQRQLARAYNNFAHIFVYQDQWAKAEEMFAKGKRLAEKAGLRSAAAWAAFNRAEALFELMRVDEAQRELEYAMPILEEAGDTHGMVIARGIYSTILATRKDFEGAEAELKKAEQLFEKLELPSLKAKLIFQQGLLSKFKGEKAEAIRLFREAKDLFTTSGSESDVARIDKQLKELA